MLVNNQAWKKNVVVAAGIGLAVVTLYWIGLAVANVVGWRAGYWEGWMWFLDYAGSVLTIAGISVLVSGDALLAWLVAASVPLVVVSGVDQVILFVEQDWMTALPCCEGCCDCCWPARWLLGRLCVVSWLCWGGSDIRTASIIAAILLLVRGASISVWLITVSATRFVLFSVDRVVLFEEADWVAVLSSL